MPPQLMMHIDGGSRGNPGPAAAAVIASDLDSGRTIHEAAYFLGTATNNVAEYQALLRALELAIRLHAESVQIVSDSELMVRQITGQYQVKSADLKPLFEQAQMLLLRIDAWQLRHVKREENRRADELVNQALDAKRNVTVKTSAALGAEASAGAEGSVAAAAADSKSGGYVWAKARLLSDPGKACPADFDGRRWASFGPTTPQGFCIYAAKAVLDHLLSQHGGGNGKGGAPACSRCRVRIDVQPED